MKKVLFIANGPLDHPIKGTPIRTSEFLRQIKKEHKVYVCAQSLDIDSEITFLDYPRGSKWEIIRYFKNLITSEKIDVILIFGELAMRLPILLKFMTGVKIAIDLHGLYFEERYYQGRISWRRKIWLELEDHFYLAFFDLIFTVSGSLKRYYRFGNKNIQVIYGGAHLFEFAPVLKEASKTVFTIGYAGNYQPYQGFTYLLEAAEKLHQEGELNFRLNLVLSGDKEKVERLIDAKGLRSMTDMYYNVPHDQVNTLLARSDVLVIARPSVKMTEYAYPSKLPEYLATAIPTILTVVGPVSELFKSTDLFVKLIPVEDITMHLKESIKQIAKLSTEERRVMGLAARHFIETNLTWEHQGRLINQYLSQL